VKFIDYLRISYFSRTMIHAWFQTSAAKQMRTASFLVITQRVVLIPCRLFFWILDPWRRGR